MDTGLEEWNMRNGMRERERKELQAFRKSGNYRKGK
jgi:hypothetical protein